MTRTWKQIGSLFLSVCMVMTMLPTAAFAETKELDSGGEITAFAALDEDIAAQTVETGTTEDELNLPTKLTVTVTRTVTNMTDSGEQEEEIGETEDTTVDVSGWTSDPAYSPEYDAERNNTYIFMPTLELLEGLTLAQDVSVPTIAVTVEKEEAVARGAIARLSNTIEIDSQSAWDTLIANPSYAIPTTGGIIQLKTDVSSSLSIGISVATDLTIDGEGHSIDGAIYFSEAIDLTLKDLTVHTTQSHTALQFRKGGSLKTEGQVTLTVGDWSENAGDGVFSNGSLTITASDSTTFQGGDGKYAGNGVRLQEGSLTLNGGSLQFADGTGTMLGGYGAEISAGDLIITSGSPTFTGGAAPSSYGRAGADINGSLTITSSGSPRFTGADGIGQNSGMANGANVSGNLSISAGTPEFHGGAASGSAWENFAGNGAFVIAAITISGNASPTFTGGNGTASDTGGYGVSTNGDVTVSTSGAARFTAGANRDIGLAVDYGDGNLNLAALTGTFTAVGGTKAFSAAPSYPAGLKEARKYNGTAASYTLDMTATSPDQAAVDALKAELESRTWVTTTLNTDGDATSYVAGAIPTSIFGSTAYTGINLTGVAILSFTAATPVAEGSFTFTVSLEKNGKTATTSPIMGTISVQPTVTLVTVSPATVQVRKGTTQQFGATVYGTNNPDQTVTWAVSGNTSAGTDITSAGLLTVDAGETASSLTVTATSTVDSSKSGTATVTVTDSAPAPVYDISLDTQSYTFPAASENYDAQAAKTITILNTGNQSTGSLTVTLSGSDFSAFAVSTDTVDSIARGGTGSFTIVPKTGLTAGTYGAARNVSGENGIGVSINVAFTVNAASPTLYTIAFNPNGGTVGAATAQTGAYGKLTSLPTPTRSGSYSFDGWYTAASGGSSSSGSSTTTTTPETTPNQPITAAAPVTATTGKNGAASASIPVKSITDAIAKAQADAKAQGKTANGTSVALDVTMPQGATSLTAELTRKSLDSLVSAGVTSLELNGSPVTVSFDTKALAEIQKQSSGNISITIVPNASLSTAAKTMIGTRPVYDLTASYTKDGKNATVSSFGGGTATVSVPYTPAKGEAIGGLYAVYVDAKGNATRIAGSAYDANSGCVLFTTTHFSLYGIGYTAPSAKFTDMKTHWAKESIDYVVGRGLLSSTSDTTFAPDTAMTRGMLVTALGRLASVDTKAYTTNSFTDVTADSAFRPYIEWAYKKGIVQGTGNGKFEPNRAITREEIAVIFANYAKATSYTLPVTRTATTYADASDIGETYKTAVTAMQQAGIMMGGTGAISTRNPALPAPRSVPCSTATSS